MKIVYRGIPTQDTSALLVVVDQNNVNYTSMQTCCCNKDLLIAHTYKVAS